MLPIEIQMQIDLSAQHHSREIAEGFAKARKQFAPKDHELMLASLLNSPAWQQNMQSALRPCNNPFLMPSNAALQNSAWRNVSGMCLWSGMF